jgi:hypothetical protein
MLSIIPFIAGDFIRISFFELYSVVLLYGIPGMVLSVPILFRTLNHRKGLLTLAVLFWIFVLPVLVMIFTGIIAPDIHSRGHAYAAWQHILFVWVPVVGFPPLLAGLVWYLKRPSSDHSQ